jgi:hypothetical protein
VERRANDIRTPTQRNGAIARNFMREHSIVSDQSNFVDVELIGESANEPVPLRIFPVCTTSQISGGCHFVTTIVSKRPISENFG